MKEKTSCAFFSHHLFKLPWGFDERHPDCVRMKSLLRAEIESLVSAGCRHFLTGHCRGADLWCAEFALEMKRASPEKNITLTAVIPFAEHRAGCAGEHRRRYFRILEHADDCVLLREWYMQGCHDERDAYMVDRADVLLAVYGGHAGGTKNAVETARQRGLELILIDPVKLSRQSR